MSNCCENCSNYTYDDESECYICNMPLDEDEMARFISSSQGTGGYTCPYFDFYDEYKIVRKQN